MPRQSVPSYLTEEPDPARRGRGPQKQHPEYGSWMCMKARCFNPNVKMYHRYGGRGITVCERWRNSFKDFLADMGPRPAPNYSLDRIDNDGNYEPGNCRWATVQQQGRNTMTARLIEFNGTTKTIAEWADSLGISRNVLWFRLKHWPKERALTAPIRDYRALSATEQLYTKAETVKYAATARCLRLILAAIHGDAGDNLEANGLAESTKQAIYKILDLRRHDGRQRAAATNAAD